MSAPDLTSLRDFAVLTQCIEFVIRNLIRILVGKISLTKLQEVIQATFVEEAENFLRKEQPDGEISLTTLAVVTGLDTRKLSEIRNAKTYARPMHTYRKFLNGITPESCVIELWMSNPRFTEPRSGEPRVLDVWGREGSFEILVKEAVRSRGVTVTSVIERLQRNGQVKRHGDERIELTCTNLAPKHLRQRIGEIKLGLDAAGHLLGTVCRNLQAHESSDSRLFQRVSWTHRLNPDKRDSLENAAREFLTEADQQARTLLETYEESVADSGQITAGIGLYYFETEVF
jgi:hypothetical protein